MTTTFRPGLECLEAREVPDGTPDGTPADTQPDLGLEYLTELRESQRVAAIAAVGGPLLVGVTWQPPVPLLPDPGLVLPPLSPVKP
jgi:hypothetical protein